MFSLEPLCDCVCVCVYACVYVCVRVCVQNQSMIANIVDLTGSRRQTAVHICEIMIDMIDYR